MTELNCVQWLGENMETIVSRIHIFLSACEDGLFPACNDFCESLANIQSTPAAHQQHLMSSCQC